MYLLHLPRLGQTMEAGKLVAWLIAEGQPFEPGIELYEVETEKATVAVEATRPGRIVKLLVALDEELPVGTPLAVVAEAGDSDVAALAETVSAESPVDPALHDGPVPKTGVAKEPARAMPAARKLAAELGVDVASLIGSIETSLLTSSSDPLFKTLM